MSNLRRYKNDEADSARWDQFDFRAGDIVISTPPKSGTTWTQLLVALLLFDGPEFPSSLGRLSPWLDLVVEPIDETTKRLHTQRHRRFIKTHTPLDGLPMKNDVRYVCVGRDIRDAALSMLHHRNNLDRRRIRELNNGELPDAPERNETQHFDDFFGQNSPNEWNFSSVTHHYATFWERRSEANVELFHFSRYVQDLPAELARLAEHLHIPVNSKRIQELAQEAKLEAVRKRAQEIAPDAHLGIWKKTEDFFRSGAEGEGERQMTAAQRDAYASKAARLMIPDLRRWVETGAF